MIWIVLAILVLAVLLFITKPFYMEIPPTAVLNSEIADYDEQVQILDAQIAENSDNVDALKASKNELQRSLLASQGKTMAVDKGPSTNLLAALFAIMIIGTLSIYMFIGRAELTKEGALKRPSLTTNVQAQTSESLSFANLISQLEEKLKGEGNTVEGWTLYARTLMNLGRYDEAIIAYERVLKMSNNHEVFVTEFAQAKAFIAQGGMARNARRVPTGPIVPNGPSQEQMKAASQMSGEDRAAMIEGMVARLAQKMVDTPDNPQGWVRLIRARTVLGHNDKIESDIEKIRKIYKDKPEVISQILRDSGRGNKP